MPAPKQKKPPVLTWHARIVDCLVHDGDTLTRVHLDVGWGIMLSRTGTTPMSIRLTSSVGPVNAPETTGAESVAGKLVRDWVQAFLLDGDEKWLISRSIDRDVHGRTVGEVHVGGCELGLRMLNLGLAKMCKPDGTRVPFTAAELAAIEKDLGGPATGAPR